MRRKMTSPNQLRIDTHVRISRDGHYKNVIISIFPVFKKLNRGKEGTKKKWREDKFELPERHTMWEMKNIPNEMRHCRRKE